MKNIHILPTKNQSRLYFDVVTKKLLLQEKLSLNATSFPIEKRNIYITSDEEIKEGDWFHLDMSHSDTLPDEIHQMGNDNWSKTGGIHFCEGNSWVKSCKKIILTTDQDLIKDGVQAIPDEFLEWFVKNPSCEEVEVKNSILKIPNRYDDDYRAIPYYKIVIPKEIDVLELGQIISKEKPKYTISNLDNDKYKDFSVSKEKPKQETELDAYYRNGIGGVIQETLEEAAEKYDENNTNDEYGKSYRAFIEGAKWQAERSYSEEEVYNIIQQLRLQLKTGVLKWQDDFEFDLSEWFEQFSKLKNG